MAIVRVHHAPSKNWQRKSREHMKASGEKWVGPTVVKKSAPMGIGRGTSMKGLHLGKARVIAVLKVLSPKGDKRYKCRCTCGREFTKTEPKLRDAFKDGKLECRPCTFGPKLYSKHPLAILSYASIKQQGNVCKAWKDNRDNFIEWMIEKGWTPGKTVVRKDPASKFSPNNCVLLEGSEAAPIDNLPTKDYLNLQVVWESLSAPDIDYETFYARYIENSWPLRKALTSPLTPKDKRRAGRQDVTAKLTAAALGFLVKKGYAVYRELAVVKQGRRRADVLGINLYGNLIICEVKSCLADFRADNKYHEYLPHCNKMYVVFPHTMKIPPDIPLKLKAQGIGIMVLEKNGYARVRVRAKHRQVNLTFQQNLVQRMVWRSAVASARTTHRVRKFL